MDHIIPYGKQNITEADIQAVINTLKSDFLTQGPKIEEFEEKFAHYVGANYAVAVSNGTAALHLAVMALELKPGEKVITTPITFAASANCIRYCGGDVIFSDIDPKTYLIDVDKLRNILISVKPGEIKGIVSVDFAGNSVNYQELRKLADEFNLWIIEDACHSPGGYFYNSDGVKVNCGAGDYVDLAVFSFHPVKHIACGEGGMITTNNQLLYKKLLTLRTHGIVKDESLFQNSKLFANGGVDMDSYPNWYMEMHSLGYNYRITDFQAALGLSQLGRAEEGLGRRREIAKRYNEAFKDEPFLKGQSGYVDGHAYHLYIVEVEDRLGLYNYLREKGIYSQIHYIPCHLMPYYRNYGYNEGSLPIAERYYARCLSLPMYPTLSDEELSFIIRTIIEYYE